MSIVNALEITKQAAKEGYAVGAFNITSINQMEGVIEAAVEKKAPLIIQASVTPSKFLKQRCRRLPHARQPGSHSDLFASRSLY